LREGKSCTFDFRPFVCLNRSTGHRSTEQPGIKLLRPFNVGNAQRHVIQRATAKGGQGGCVSLRIGHHADRWHSSEQALNQLLSVQRAFLEQRDEILNGVLHTLLLLGRLHAATVTADAQRPRSAAEREQRERTVRCTAEFGGFLYTCRLDLMPTQDIVATRSHEPPAAGWSGESGCRAPLPSSH